MSSEGPSIDESGDSLTLGLLRDTTRCADCLSHTVVVLPRGRPYLRVYHQPTCPHVPDPGRPVFLLPLPLLVSLDLDMPEEAGA